jgi:hypothetical protein
MGRFRVTITALMGLVLFVGVAFAALRDASEWWAGALLVLTIGLLLTACLGVVYRTGGDRAFWLGMLVFGGGYLLLGRFVFTDPDVGAVALTNRTLDALALNRRSALAAGEKVLADMGGKMLPASVVQIDSDNSKYLVRYEGWSDYHNSWVGLAGIKAQHTEVYHAVGNLVVLLLFALAGSVTAVAFHASRERRRGPASEPAAVHGGPGIGARDGG